MNSSPADPILIDPRPDDGVSMYLRPHWDEDHRDWCTDVLFLHRAQPGASDRLPVPLGLAVSGRGGLVRKSITGPLPLT